MCFSGIPGTSGAQEWGAVTLHERSEKDKCTRGSLGRCSRKEHAALAEGESSPSPYMVAHRRSSVLWSMQAAAYMWCLYIHSVSMHIHKIK